MNKLKDLYADWFKSAPVVTALFTLGIILILLGVLQSVPYVEIAPEMRNRAFTGGFGSIVLGFVTWIVKVYREGP